MMIFTSDMHPRALLKNKGEPIEFKCDFCGATDEGVRVQPSDPNREAWAVLPDGWTEVEDRREHAKKQFPLCCGSGDCLFEAEKHRG